MRSVFRQSLLTLSLVACQMPPVHDSPPSASPSPSVSPEASPSPSAENPVLLPGCSNDVLICRTGEPCIQPSCAPTEPQPEPLPAESIAESNFEALQTRFGFYTVQPVQLPLGALTPAHPLAEGRRMQCDQGQGVIFYGGLMASCGTYLVESPTGLHLLDSPALFRDFYAPIESTAEALAYTMALTGHQAVQAPRQLVEPHFRFFANLLPASRVQAVGADYQVSLYAYQRFGCGPHPHEIVSYQLSRAGELREIQREKLFENPDLDGLCVD